MGAHSSGRGSDRNRDLVRDRNALRPGDWVFVGVMAIVASTGAYLFVMYLFERLGI